MKHKVNKVNKSKLRSGSIVTALIAAVAVFAVMLQMEKNVLTRYEKGSIYVARKQIPEGVVIRESNLSTYFDLKELDKSVIPDAALKAPEEVLNLVSRYAIDKDTLLTTGMFENLDEIQAEMKEPVIAGLKAEDLYQVVGGTLRTGDRIDIYKIDSENLSQLVWKDVYVYEAFDNTGEAIPEGDITTAAQRINIYLESAEVENFYTELSLGSLRAVKVCD